MRVSLLLGALMLAANTYPQEDLPTGFLEFLGMMVEQDGEWIDPLSMAADPEGIAAAVDAADRERGIEMPAEGDEAWPIEDPEVLDE